MRAVKASFSENEWRYLPLARAVKGLDDWAVAEAGACVFLVVLVAILGPPVVAHAFLCDFQSSF